jgi:hypothetical protein
VICENIFKWPWDWIFCYLRFWKKNPVGIQNSLGKELGFFSSYHLNSHQMIIHLLRKTYHYTACCYKILFLEIICL